TGLRFYRGPTDTTSHVGTLWKADGTSLGSLTFPARATAGWQDAYFATPLPVTTGTEYRAGYVSDGSYAISLNGLASALTNGPLSTVANGSAYKYGTGIP
ncbi:DUF4082 domain-containing protein, partial [Rhizobium johnstonii]|uniref:DUF4082 domain-containing protein n=1 Tax=Rhizobium johnstonii TaxID=3019933 RepID=UPI003F9A292B